MWKRFAGRMESLFRGSAIKVQMTRRRIWDTRYTGFHRWIREIGYICEDCFYMNENEWWEWPKEEIERNIELFYQPEKFFQAMEKGKAGGDKESGNG